MATDPIRSFAARNKNSKPCSHCQQSKQKCDTSDGYPCHNCKRSNRSGCEPANSQPNFIQYNPATQRRSGRPNTGDGVISATTSTNMGNINAQVPRAHSAPTGHSAPSSNSGPVMFGHVQLLSSTGAADGYVASFIHTHGGVSYYGARYYDARQQFVRDDLFLSRVGPDDTMQMLPPSPIQAPYAANNQYGTFPTGR